ncbi:MAG TPA: NAD(P)/FAD-dependent oxidoreductase [Solirubrobacteraceae bacterium]|nr:NAD(P)/FAD-dependent oxidoreductase [Solirubrobacteraceae bacterium]HME03645.1 NAD(P)/FAD-dependent oxidoreductase [Solirubrobacteraceae bacterium]
MAAEANARPRRRVVIVGGGFGGLTAARELGGADVEVTLVDPMAHHLFQPLLYQAACGGLSTGECASPIRAAVKHHPNTAVLMARASHLDVERRQVVLDRGERLDYDSLIVACGAQTSYFGNDEWAEHSYGLKTLADAVRLRNRIYGAFEEAERAQDPAERERWLTFVVIGGGPTGVELAGELAIITAHTLKGYYSRIEPSAARVILLDAGERVTAAFSSRLSAKVARYLAELGVRVREHARVTTIDAEGVTVEVDGGEERIASRTVVWAAGVRAAGFAETLARATGAQTDRAGRVQIEPDLTIAGHPEISVIGDATVLAGPKGKTLPGLATVSIQQARHVASAIRQGAAGARTPFRYFDKGALAVIGRGKAVCEIRGLELSGRLAFLTYLSVHMYYLSGGGPGHRLKVLIDWISARVGDPQNQVIDAGLDFVEHLPESLVKD